MEWNRMECNVMNINGPEAATHGPRQISERETVFQS